MQTETQPSIGETLIDSRQAAKKLGCSVRHLDSLRAVGKIPFIRIGNLVRFSPTALDEMISEQLATHTRTAGEHSRAVSDDVRTLHQDGDSVAVIAQKLHLPESTVQHAVETGKLPEPKLQWPTPE